MTLTPAKTHSSSLCRDDLDSGQGQQQRNSSVWPWRQASEDHCALCHRRGLSPNQGTSAAYFARPLAFHLAGVTFTAAVKEGPHSESLARCSDLSAGLDRTTAVHPAETARPVPSRSVPSPTTLGSTPTSRPSRFGGGGGGGAPIESDVCDRLSINLPPPRCGELSRTRWCWGRTKVASEGCIMWRNLQGLFAAPDHPLWCLGPPRSRLGRITAEALHRLGLTVLMAS